MEPFGRGWEILKYFHSVQGSRWSTRFATVASIRNTATVDDSNLPAWMQQTEEIDHDTMVSPAQEPEFLTKSKLSLSGMPRFRLKGSRL
jgi:hypothetical protein